MQLFGRLTAGQSIRNRLLFGRASLLSGSPLQSTPQQLARPLAAKTTPAQPPPPPPPPPTTTDGDVSSYHVPVLKTECLHYLDITPGGVYVDCTLGGGGHTRAILQAGGRVVAFDQDPDSIAAASARLDTYLQQGSLEIFQANFRSFANIVRTQSKLAKGRDDSAAGDRSGYVDGILMDLGVSSHQIDEASRGFSFGRDGPLDMRMSQGQGNSNLVGNELRASTIVNEWDAERLANVLYELGDETRSRQIAREIVAARPLQTTGELERLISRITPFAHRPKTLARCFQALRIVVNDELGALDEALTTAHSCLRPGGRLVVISYHSLEDRRVKRVMRTGRVAIEGEEGEAKLGAGQRFPDNPWQPLFKRAKAPTDEEVERNRRARSAKLRVAECLPQETQSERVEADRRQALLGTGRANVAFVGRKQRERLQRRLEEQEEQEGGEGKGGGRAR